MELCKRLKAELPQELLEEIFHRLPFATLRHAKQVCREWRRVMRSASFTASYRGTVTLVQTYVFGYDLAEVIDDDDNVLCVRRDWGYLFGKLACPKTGLLTTLYYQKGGNMFFVGNLFSNKWEEVPVPPIQEWPCGSSLAVFGLGDGRYKLVYWSHSDIYVRESGAQEWTKRWSRSPGDSISWRHWRTPEVVGNSLFRLDQYKRKLVEYNIPGEGKLREVDLTSKEKLELAVAEESVLVAWENRLYLLLMISFGENGETLEYQRMELWMISTTDGACTLVMKHAIEELVDVNVSHVEIDDSRLLVVYHDAEGEIRLISNMDTKKVESVESFREVKSFRRGTMTVPVRLC